jgi:hypothetical protein
VRELKGLGPIHESVCCPISYGVVFAEKYNPLKHSKQGDVPEISALDGKKYIYGGLSKHQHGLTTLSRASLSRAKASSENTPSS